MLEVVMKDELGCVISQYSSRVCEKGTKSCIYHHGEVVMKRSECVCQCHNDVYGIEPIVHCVPCCEPDEVTIKSAFSPELCAMEILDEAIEAMRKAKGNSSVTTSRAAIKILKKLKDKYNDR